VVIRVGIGGCTWRHPKGCVKVKQLRVERVAIGEKLQELVHFTPDEVDILYVSRGSLESTNNPL
jgi:hypothetical protein